MNVLVVAPHLPPSRIGGVEVYAEAVADHLAALGHRVEAAAVETLATGGSDACTATTDHTGRYPVHRLTLTLRAGRSFPLFWDHAPAESWLDATIERLTPDVVHVQSGYLLGGAALAAAQHRAVSAIVTLHDYWFACPRITLLHPDGARCNGPDGVDKCAWCLIADKRRYRLANRATGGHVMRMTRRSAVWRLPFGDESAAIDDRQQGLARALHSAAAVLAPTRFLADRIATAGCPRDRIRVVRCGIAPMASVARVPRGDALRLTYLGQVKAHKGVHAAVAAVRASRNPHVSLAIHGPLASDDPYVGHVRQLAAADSRIRFYGAYARQYLPAIFAVTDALVVPSLWHEVAALTIQEAQGAGVPVLASRVGGTPELVTHDHDGLLFDPDDHQDLGRQIDRLHREPGLLARLAAGTRPPRSIDEDVESLVRLYESVRRGRGSSDRAPCA